MCYIKEKFYLYKYSKLKEKIKNYSNNNKLLELQSFLHKIESIFPTSGLYSQNNFLLENIQKDIKELQNLNEIKAIDSKKNKINYYYTQTELLSQNLPKDKYGDNMLWCKMLLKKIKYMIFLMEENLDTIDYGNKIFEFYIPEIIQICENIPNKKAETYVDYMKNLNKVLSQLLSLVEINTNKIINFTDKNSEISLNVLIREMENDKKMN